MVEILATGLPGRLLSQEVSPKNVVRIRDDGLEQLVVGGPGQFFKCWKVPRQIATAPQPCNQSVVLKRGYRVNTSSKGIPNICIAPV